jgi:hypothetical protein
MNSAASEILKIYLGAGPTGGYQPGGHKERMYAAFANSADAKIDVIQKYLDIEHPISEWLHSDLAKEQQEVEVMLAQRFPELDKVAVNSLACWWSYSWK